MLIDSVLRGGLMFAVAIPVVFWTPLPVRFGEDYLLRSESEVLFGVSLLVIWIASANDC